MENVYVVSMAPPWQNHLRLRIHNHKTRLASSIRVAVPVTGFAVTCPPRPFALVGNLLENECLFRNFTESRRHRLSE
jgi:hypothetical protein